MDEWADLQRGGRLGSLSSPQRQSADRCHIMATAVARRLRAEGQLCPQGWLTLPASAARVILAPRSRWRLRLEHWDGKPAKDHREELVAAWRKQQQLDSTAPSAPRPFLWPADRLVLNTAGAGEPAALHTRAAACAHMGAPLDKSPLVRLPHRDRPGEGLALRCVTCQRRPNIIDAASATICADGSVRLRFTNHEKQNCFQDSVGPRPATVVLIERFPEMANTLNRLPEGPLPTARPAHNITSQTANPCIEPAHIVESSLAGWVCPCDHTINNASRQKNPAHDICGRCGARRKV